MVNRILLIGSEGFIGRCVGASLLEKYEVDLCDLKWFTDIRDTEIRHKPMYRDYKDLKPVSLERYDAVILLAGHSSVSMCKNDMASCLNNNVRNFWTLVNNLGASQPLIYASSGSVYGHGESHKQFFEHDPLPPAMNWYDFSKQEIDRIAALSGKKCYGLRFGTVCGASPNIRTELMLNSMYLSANNAKVVKYNNENTNRAILGMKDLVRGIGAILSYIEEKGPKNPGAYNLASFNSTIGYMAKTVANLMEVNIEKIPDTPSYSFMLNVEKFQQVFDWRPEQDIKDILDDLALNHGKMLEDHRKLFTRDRMIKYE